MTKRNLLINPSGRRLLEKLKEGYPDITWILMFRNGKEVCVGLKDMTPIVFGDDYDMIVDNIR